MTTEAAYKAWETRRRNGWVHPSTLAKELAATKKQRQRSKKVVASKKVTTKRR